MRLSGHIYRSGNFWLAEVPLLEALTQGATRKEAFAMIADWVETIVNHPGFAARVHQGTNGHFEIDSNDPSRLIGLLLRRQRERSGLSLAEAARRTGAKTPSAYARFERGTSPPSLQKLDELLSVVAPDHALVLDRSTTR